jgi:uncharacterized protein
MNNTTLQKILHFFLVKIIIGIAVVAGSVFLTDWLIRQILQQTSIVEDVKNLIIAITESLAALVSYIFLFRFYEHRKIQELSAHFLKNATIGFLTGLILQSLFILIIYLAGEYSITKINPVSFLLPALSTALMAGFVAEILIRGIVFRLLEEKLGTVITLIIAVLLFALFHTGNKNATALSVLATSARAGLLLSAAYVFSRSLWLPIFLHFAWDFTEPGIFGAINPGNTIEKSLLISHIRGNELITGGALGPENSVEAFLLCVIGSFIFLWLAKQKNNFIQPYWKK